MTANLTRRESPEEAELKRQQKKLARLEGVLAEKELGLATQQAEVFLFERRYMKAVGSLYSDLAVLEARLAEALAKRNPTDSAARQRAEAARTMADETAHEPEESDQVSYPSKFQPTEELKRLYRQVAKQVHPDLATGEEDRQRRTTAMVKANRAYAEGDAPALHRILEEWNTNPDSVTGVDVGSQLVRVVRMIANVTRRIQQIARDLDQLARSPMFGLWKEEEEQRRAGRDLLTELATMLTKKIDVLRRSLEVLEQQPR